MSILEKDWWENNTDEVTTYTIQPKLTKKQRKKLEKFKKIIIEKELYDTTKMFNKAKETIKSKWHQESPKNNVISELSGTKSHKRLRESINELGKKENNNKLNYELDWDFITAMAERISSNKHKYAPYNWKKSIDIEEIKQALFRHTIEVMKGNFEDDKRILGHLEAIAVNTMIINYHLK